MPQSDYNVNINIQAKDKTSEPAKRATKSLGGLASAAKLLAGAMAARQIVKYTVELAKVGATAQRQANALDNLASAAGTSGDAIIKAIQGASNYTIDQMTAMQAANRAMVMDVAQTPEAFERLTKVATALGRAMGQDAAKSIDDFVTAAGRQSKMIADNLGLIVNAEDAYLRYAEANNTTVDAMDDAAKKQAFLTEMLRQGEAKMADLGDQSLDAAGSIEQMGAAAADAKTSLGIIVSTMVQATGVVPKLAAETRRLADGMTAVAEAGGPNLNLFQKAVAEGNRQRESSEQIQQRYLALLRAESGMYDELGTEIGRYAYVQEQSAEIARYGHSQVAEAAADEAAAIKMTADERNAMLFAMHQTNRAQEELASTTPPATRALEDEGKAAGDAEEGLSDLARAAADVAATQLDLSMRFTSQFASEEESAKEFATRRETIEAEHQEKMAGLRRRGQSSAIKIDAEAQRAKIAELQRDLDIAMQAESEIGEKAKQSTRMRAADRVSDLQGRLAEETRLLEDHEAGRLVRAGENVTQLMALEEERKNAALASLDEEMAKQEQVQQKAMGNMMLNAFDAWTRQKEATGEVTDQNIKDITEMRAKIAEQYGLVEKGTADLVSDMSSEWDTWISGMGTSTDTMVGYMDAMMQATEEERAALVELTAKTWWITVRWDLVGDTKQPYEGAKRQYGGTVSSKQAYLVGESGPELFVPYSAGRIMANSQSSVYNSQDTYVFNTPHGPAAVLESQRRARRRQMGRIM